MKIGFIVVLYKTPQAEIDRIAREIRALKIKDYSLYCIDNSKENRGFAGGVNVGITNGLKDNVDYFVVLNPDIHLPKSIGGELLKGATHFDIWGGAMLQQNKEYFGGELDGRRMSGGLNEKKPQHRFVKCDFVSGSLMVISRSTIKKIGQFSEDYFMYYEDVDYCQRARMAGLRVGIDADLKYEHFETSDQNPKKDWYLATNRLRFLFKHGSLKQRLWEVVYAPKTCMDLMRARFHQKKLLINFTSMSISSVINRLLTFLLFITLVKLMPVGDYGEYALVWAHVGILMPLLDLGTTTYSLVELPSKTESAFFNVFSLRVLLSVVIFLFTLFLAFIFHYEARIIGYIALTGAAIFANSMSGSFLIASSLKQKLHYPALVSVAFQIVVITTLISSLFINKNIGIVFALTCILYCVYTALNATLIIKSFKGAFRFHFDISSWKEIVSKSYVYVLIGIFAGIYYGADIFLLKIIKGTEVVGKYAAGYKFYDSFMFLAANYSIAATPLLAMVKKQGRYIFGKRVRRDSFVLFGIGTLISLCVITLSPLLLQFILRQEYAESIHVLKIVILSLPWLLATTVFLNVMYLYKKQHWVVCLFLFQVFFNIILNIYFIPIYSLYASAYITVIGEVINTIVSGILVFKLLNTS